MQRSIKNDLVYLLRACESIGKIKIYSKGFTDSIDFFEANEQQNFNASLALLLTIGEQISKISDELKSKYESIKWSDIRNFRNRLAHDYTGIDKFITYEIIENDLTVLQDNIHTIIEAEVIAGNFDVKELIAAKGNQYYRHVDFNNLPEL